MSDFKLEVTVAKSDEPEKRERVSLPTTHEEMNEAFRRIGIEPENKSDWDKAKWTIVECECSIKGIADFVRGDSSPSLDELNYLASLVTELPKKEQDKYAAVAEVGFGSFDDFIGLTQNLDLYDYDPNIKNGYALGVKRAEIPESLGQYFDFEKYGYDIAEDENGWFANGGYVVSTGGDGTFTCSREAWDYTFDSAQDDVPDEYRITGPFDGEEMEQNEPIKAVVVEPGMRARIEEIDSGLESFQKLVGGYIQALYPYDDEVAIVCNEEGKINGLPLNRALRDADGDIYDVVAGNFLVVGLTEDNFGSLTDDLAEKYRKKFSAPEVFLAVNGKVRVITTEKGKEQGGHRAATKEKNHEDER